ncbi:MAG: hypothetical protein LBR79_05130 [Oscillospiraceae bacterium]|nr:hypothetical protein [Oscillospiraceae bacterium]
MAFFKRNNYNALEKCLIFSTIFPYRREDSLLIWHFSKETAIIPLKSV